jgi:phage terminase large subunit-like protein
VELEHPKAAHQYALDVVAGSIPAGKYHKLACQRFLDDLERTDIHFDEKAANKPCKFIEALPHVSGEWKTRKAKIKLEPVQSFIVCNIFGWHDLDGDRRFNEAFVLMPRKNAKSTLASGIGLYMLCADGESAPEVYAGASSEAQAYKVFGPAREMVRLTPKLKSHYNLQTPVKSIIAPDNYGVFKPIIGKPGDGDSPSCAIADEYHEHVDNHLVAAMRTGMGARRNPLLLCISTAGSNLSGPAFERCQEIQKLLEGSYEDDSAFGIIFHCDEDDQWDSEEALIKANPLWGISKNAKNTLRELTQARRSAFHQNDFKTKHLNQWVGSKVAWMNMLAWQRQKRECVLEDFKGKRAWLSVDLNSKVDLAAIGILIPDGNEFRVFAEFFAPEAAVDNNDFYRMHAERMTVTPGNATDYGFIEARIEALARILDVQEVAFDQWQAQYLAQRMIAKGMNMVEFPHQVRTMSDPMKELEALVLDGRLWHSGCPLLTWNMANTVCKADAKENVYPTKERPNDDKCKIDGVVALIMAMGRYLAADTGANFGDWLANPIRYAQ